MRPPSPQKRLTGSCAPRNKVHAAYAHCRVEVAAAAAGLGSQLPAGQGGEALRRQARGADTPRRQVGAHQGQSCGLAAAGPIPPAKLQVYVALGAGQPVGWVRCAAGRLVKPLAGARLVGQQRGPWVARQRAVHIPQACCAPAIAARILQGRPRPLQESFQSVTMLVGASSSSGREPCCGACTVRAWRLAPPQHSS